MWNENIWKILVGSINCLVLIAILLFFTGSVSAECLVSSEETITSYTKANLHKHPCMSKKFSMDNQNDECGDILDYQCGVKTFDNLDVDYGSCSEGYDCSNNLCIAATPMTCDNVSCGPGEYCSNGVCLLEVPGNTYFVATWGRDDNPGTFQLPFKTWQKGVNVSAPGDIIYIRGGVWQPTARINRVWGMSIYKVHSGTKEAPIRYHNYPGERPIIDGGLMGPDPDNWNTGIKLEGVEYIELKGLTVRHVYQAPYNPDHPRKKRTEAYGIGAGLSANIKMENMVSHDIDGRAFQHTTSAWDAWEAEYSYLLCIERGRDDCKRDVPDFTEDNSSWINCDAYNIFDRYSTTPGNAADGWKVGTASQGTYIWEGVRVWNYSDDGIDPSGPGKKVVRNSWMMPTRKYKNIDPTWDTEGNGIKMTGVLAPKAEDYPNSQNPHYRVGGAPYQIVTNTVVVDSEASAMANDFLVNYRTMWPSNGLIYNNLSYKTKGGFYGGGFLKAGEQNPEAVRTTTYKNNIAYGSTYDGYGMTPAYEVTIYRPAVYPHSNNTWVATGPESDWPGWRYNPEVEVTEDDFSCTDISEIMSPRRADFSLPEIKFGSLAADSDLIDAGTIIPGFHCVTTGAHPNENCVEWYGLAPDIGPIEYVPTGSWLIPAVLQPLLLRSNQTVQ